MEHQTTLSVSQETCVRAKKQQLDMETAGHGKTDWFKIGKCVRQGHILSPCLFNFFADYIMQNARLDET